MENKKSNSRFMFTIEKWEKQTSSDSNADTIIYQVEVESCLKGQKWTLSRTLKSLQAVLNDLSNIHFNMPLPPKMIEEKESPSTITLLGKKFELYIKSLLTRGDIINSKIIIDFFELKRLYPEIDKCQIKVVNTLKTKFQVSDFYFNESDSLMFIAFGKKLANGFGFIESTIPYSVLNFFNREPLGQIMIYKLNRDTFELLYEQDTKSEVDILKYYQSRNNNYLIASYYNGAIDIFECPLNHLTYVSSKFLKLINTIEVTKTKLISFGFNVISLYLYSIPKKGKELFVFFFDANKTEKVIPLSDSPIIGFDYDDSHNRFMILNEEAIVTIYYIENNANVQKDFAFKSNFNDSVSLFKVNYESKHIFIAGSYGKMVIYSFNDSMTIITKAYSFNFKQSRLDNQSYVDKASLYEITEVEINPSKKELMIGLSNGVLQIFSHAIDNAEYAIDINQSIISKIKLYSKNDKAIIAGHDQSISLISIPSLYFNERIISIKDYNAINIFNYPSSQQCRNELSINKYK